MKKAILALALCLVSYSAHADQKDLKTMKTLLSVGAQVEQFMSQMHVGLDDVQCVYSHLSKHAACTAQDISADEGNGAKLELKGKKAERLLTLIENLGAEGDAAMGRVYFEIKSIRCTQAVEGVADGSAADRTDCSVEVTEAQ